MPYLRVGLEVRVRESETGDEFVHYFTAGQRVIVTSVFDQRGEGRANLEARSLDCRSSQLLSLHHIESLDGEPIEFAPTLADIVVGAEFTVTSGYRTGSRMIHYFPLGTRVRVVAAPDSYYPYEFQVEGVNGELADGMRTQYMHPDNIGIQVEREQVEHTEQRYTCRECGNSYDNGEISVCGNCGALDCCRRFCVDCGDCRDCCYCRSELINDSGCRTYPAMRPSPAPYPNFLYLGVELEVECGDDNREDVARVIDKKHHDLLMLKDDGSLSCGFEMVTGPYSLEEHQKIWGDITETAVRAGARSWGHSSTGLHVHLSRKFFTPLVLGKMLVFLNSEQTRKQIIRLAGRESYDYAAMCKKKHSDVYGYRTEWNDRLRTEERVRRSGRRCTGSGNRYEILNLTPEHTVEIRIFKGTLNEGHVLADIEFCHAVAYWATDCSIAESESWASFWRYVLGHRKLYSHLIKYMARKPESEK